MTPDRGPIRVNMGQLVSLTRTLAPRLLPVLGQGGARAARILIVIYFAQAGVGIAAGVTYAVWLLYW
jgi:hypothetical protein